jgi:hypothetical protein
MLLLGTKQSRGKLLHLKVLEWVSVYIGALLFMNMEGCTFIRDFEIKRYIKRYVKMPCTLLSLSVGALMRNLEGICLPGHFEIPGFLSWNQRTLRF